MTYAVKEIYPTLQGEGYHTGRPAVFLRFAGCNLWSGLEKDRAKAICKFCDTDFVRADAGRFRSAKALAKAVAAKWKSGEERKFVVVTGGEPLLQLDAAAVEALHAAGFEVAVETNGTIAPPAGIDWITMSPKAGTKLKVVSGNELKLVYPQAGAAPELYESLAFDHFFLQPMDGFERDGHTRLAIEYVTRHPRWRLSLQTHKLLGIR
jgi:7-carboxy-7-deazaguanine synthase (Cx14CxxC type)